MYIPNLFGAYMEGREKAINANWNDLSRFEQIEAARINNDRNTLNLLKEQATLNNDIANSYYDTSAKAMNDEVLRAAQGGKVSNANMQTGMAQAQEAAFNSVYSLLPDTLRGTLLARLAQQRAAQDYFNAMYGNFTQDQTGQYTFNKGSYDGSSIGRNAGKMATQQALLSGDIMNTVYNNRGILTDTVLNTMLTGQQASKNSYYDATNYISDSQQIKKQQQAATNANLLNLAISLRGNGSMSHEDFLKLVAALQSGDTLTAASLIPDTTSMFGTGVGTPDTTTQTPTTPPANNQQKKTPVKQAAETVATGQNREEFREKVAPLIPGSGGWW